MIRLMHSAATPESSWATSIVRYKTCLLKEEQEVLARERPIFLAILKSMIISEILSGLVEIESNTTLHVHQFLLIKVIIKYGHVKIWRCSSNMNVSEQKRSPSESDKERRLRSLTPRKCVTSSLPWMHSLKFTIQSVFTRSSFKSLRARELGIVTRQARIRDISSNFECFKIDR